MFERYQIAKIPKRMLFNGHTVVRIMKLAMFNFNLIFSKYFFSDISFYILIVREGIRFMYNLTPSVFIKSPRFETPWLRKNGFYDSVCVCLLSLSSVTAITFERIIRLDFALEDFFGAQKERTSSLTSHFWSTVMVLSALKTVFTKSKNQFSG